MKRLLSIAGLFLAFGSSALAFEPGVEAVIAQHKMGKPVTSADLAKLMRGSGRWCYLEEAGSCAWSDIYLAVDEAGAEYEVSNAWSERVEIAFVDYGVFEDDRMLCESGVDWLASVRGMQRDDGQLIGGRALRDLKSEIAVDAPDDGIDCFDYL